VREHLALVIGQIGYVRLSRKGTDRTTALAVECREILVPEQCRVRCSAVARSNHEFHLMHGAQDLQPRLIESHGVFPISISDRYPPRIYW